MVTGTHPEEVDLFDYVEGELPADRRTELEVHLASCATCAEQVALVRAGKDALRDSQLLHLPPVRREAISTSLPTRRRAPGRRPALSPRRLLAFLTPVAAIAAVVVVLVSSGVFETNGNDEAGSAAAGATSQLQTEDQGGGAEAAAPVMKVAGPAATVADELRRKGIRARVVGNSVEVRDATPGEVQQALKNRRTGRVEIVLIP
jgi:anti-sigma factor RsiW